MIDHRSMIEYRSPILKMWSIPITNYNSDSGELLVLSNFPIHLRSCILWNDVFKITRLNVVCMLCTIHIVCLSIMYILWYKHVNREVINMIWSIRRYVLIPISRKQEFESSIPPLDDLLPAPVNHDCDYTNTYYLRYSFVTV